jgi:hypothetical protein
LEENISKLYDLRAWRNRVRIQALHDGGYQCVRCGVSLFNDLPNAIIHHRKYVSRAPALFLEPLNLVVLCRSCHSIIHKQESKNENQFGCDVSGQPLSPTHPWNGGDPKNSKRFLPASAVRGQKEPLSIE